MEHEEDINDLSLLDLTNVDTMLQGGLDRFYLKVRAQKKFQQAGDMEFENLSFSADVNLKEPDSIRTWISAPLRLFSRQQRKQRQTVLHSMSGRIPAGSLTLLLGGPQSGKSSLLNILTGSIPPSKGTVLLDGQNVRNIATSSRRIGMVPQHDKHHPYLTVKETLEFARACHIGFEREDDRMIALKAEFVMRLLGIEHTANTIVGSAEAGIRGVSGGERKRVTIAEILVGDQSWIAIDEMNTGLDSQATLDVVKSMRTWCDALQTTCVISMLQPQSDVLEVFDRIMLLNQGRLVYNGPVCGVVDHFSKIGLRPEPHVELGEWLLKVICEHQKPDWLVDHYRKELLSGFLSNPATQSDRTRREQCYSVGKEAKRRSKGPYVLSFGQDLLLLLSRQWKLTIRNKVLNFSILAEAILVSLLIGFAFFDVQQPLLVMSLLFAIISLLSRQAWQVIPIVLSDREIFNKHKSLKMHRTSTFVIAQVISQLPVNAAAVFLLATPMYFLANLSGSSPWRYFASLMVLFLTQQALRSWMTFLAALTSSISTAQGLSAIFIVMSLLFSGFIILEGLIPTWAVWVYWMSPISWGIRALAQIEFLSDYWSIPRAGLTGVEALLSYQFSTDSIFITAGCLVLLGNFLIVGVIGAGLAFHFVKPRRHFVLRRDKEGDSVELWIEGGSLPPSVTGEKKLEDSNDEVCLAMKDKAQFDEDDRQTTLAIVDLRYKVHGKTLLQGVTAVFKPSTMTALMGCSGAGKTTLLDCIAQRKTGGEITGKILFDGKELEKHRASRLIGYCEQFDEQIGQISVLESFLFSSKLRRPTNAKVDHQEWCEEQLALLSLSAIAHDRIGSLTFEQRKRVSIGQELCADPRILFLDEPTSGVDAEGAKTVVDAMRLAAKSGRTVVATIHQPSTAIFESFNSLLLLGRGGRTVYFGEIGKNSCNLLHYFEQIPECPPCGRQENPASFVLRLISTPGNNFAEYFQGSQQKTEGDFKVNQIVNSAQPTSLPETFRSEAYPSVKRQTFECIKRMLLIYHRSPEYTLLRPLLSMAIGSFLGLIYFQFGYDTSDKARSQVGIVYLALDMIGIISMVLVIPLMFRLRPVFYREVASNYYMRSAHAIAILLVEIPYIIVYVSGYAFTSYFLIGLDSHWVSFLWFLLAWLLYVTATTFEAVCLTFWLPSPSVAQVFVGVLTGVFNLFSGFLLPRPEMQVAFLPLYFFNHDTYALNGIVSNAFASCPYSTEQVIENPHLEIGSASCTLTVDSVLNSTTTLEDFMVSAYGFQPERQQTDLIVLGLWIVSAALLSIFGANYVSYEKK